MLIIFLQGNLNILEVKNVWQKKRKQNKESH